MALASLCCMISCEKKTIDDEKDDDNGIITEPVDFPYEENTLEVDGSIIGLSSTALTMVGENLAIAASPEEGLADVTTIMESDEFFYAAVGPVLLDKEFNPKTESSIFTLISTISDMPLETVAPDKTSEIKNGRCYVTFEEKTLTLKAELTLADGTSVGMHITAKAKEGDEIIINENLIGRGDEVKPLRASFYKESEGLTYLFFTPANISYFSELSIATWYLYLVVNTADIEGNPADGVRFGLVDNVDSSNNFELDAVGLADAAGAHSVSSDGEGKYKTSLSYSIDGLSYFIKFDGTCISADLEKPVEILETFFKYNGEELTIESAGLVKKEEVWTLNLAVSNGKTASVTMSSDLFAEGGVFGFSQDPDMSVEYDGKTYSKANGYSGTVTMHIDETNSMVETKFTNYKDLEFYYKGMYE